MRLWLGTVVLALAGTVSAAQEPAPSLSANPQAPANQPKQAVKNPPQPVMHDGHPALRYNARAFGFFVEMVKYQGEPALRYPSAIGNCTGAIYVTRTRVSGDFSSGQGCQSFDAPREQVQAEKAGMMAPVQLTTPSGSYTVTMVGEKDGTTKVLPAGHESLVRSVKNFPAIFGYFRRMTAELSGGSGQPGTPGQAANTGNAAGTGVQLSIHSDPGDVQVYVNNEPRGLTGEDGNEVFHLRPGTYNLRLDLPGYKEWTQSVTLAAGHPQDVNAKLETLGPPPFTAADVAEMLQGKMSSKRIATLVEERGVDFALTEEQEKQFRAAGADDALLLAIATKKK